MEVLERYGRPEHKKEWLEPLLEGKIRSAFAMTEPKVASSDATNIESSITRDGDSYVINGHKWWTSGIGDPRCKVLIFMGKTDAKNPDKYKQQSMILVPRDTPGHQGAPDADRLRLRRRAPRPRGSPLRERARARLQPAPRGRAGLRDRAGAAGAGPHPPLHASDRRGRARARADVPRGPPSGWPSASRSPTTTSRWSASRSRASRSTRRGSSCFTRPT